MRKGIVWHHSRPLLLAGIISIVGAGTALAQTSSSPTYQVSETDFGATSLQQNCSAQYCAKASIGNMSGEDSVDEGSTATFSSVEGSEPHLDVIVDPGESNLGVLTTETTATKTMIVRISNYLGDGYSLLIEGEPPKFAGHTLATSATPVASVLGSEQFGINAVANTTPNVGAGPEQVPSGQETFGVVDDDYLTSNLFKFASGDVIARSQAESGRTDYTISMIINVSNSTPAGHYSGDFAAVVIPAY